MESRSLFGVDTERVNEMQLVRDRWALLWQALGGAFSFHQRAGIHDVEPEPI
jgi:hypothetical protein